MTAVTRPAFFVATAVLFVIIGCGADNSLRTSSKPDVRGWRGRQVSELIRAWGQPDFVVRDPAHPGGKSLTYRHTLRAASGPGQGLEPPRVHAHDTNERNLTGPRSASNPDPSLLPGASSVAEGTFWVDSLGVIIRAEQE
jgi:hypothetical protein